jgi:hypothetical protein
MKFHKELEQLDREAMRLVMTLPESFLELGQVLAQIHDQKLWQANFKSFDQYLRSFKERCIRRIEYYSLYTGSGLYTGYNALLDKIVSDKPVNLLRKNLHELRSISLERSTAYDLIRIAKSYGWDSDSLLKPFEVLWQASFKYSPLRLPSPSDYREFIERYIREIGWSKLAALFEFADLAPLLQEGFLTALLLSRRKLQQFLEEQVSFVEQHKGEEGFHVVLTGDDLYHYWFIWCFFPSILRVDPDKGLVIDILLPGYTEMKTLDQPWQRGEPRLAISIDHKVFNLLASKDDDPGVISNFFRFLFEALENVWPDIVRGGNGLETLLIQVE